MTETTLPYSNPPVSRKKSRTTVFVAVVIIVVIVAAIIFMIRKPKKTEETKVDNIVKNEQPTPTEKPKIDKKTVKIQVLNGTGKPGQAGAVVEVLKKEEYNSDNIKSGNAEKFDSVITTIKAKKGFEDIADEIKNALKNTFEEINIDSTKLDEGNEFDIVITTGGKKYEEEAVAPSPTESATPTPTETPTLTPTPSPTP